jgi:hypothetical protein
MRERIELWMSKLQQITQLLLAQRFEFVWTRGDVS